jgi:hypothetical protein
MQCASLLTVLRLYLGYILTASMLQARLVVASRIEGATPSPLLTYGAGKKSPNPFSPLPPRTLSISDIQWEAFSSSSIIWTAQIILCELTPAKPEGDVGQQRHANLRRRSSDSPGKPFDSPFRRLTEERRKLALHFEQLGHDYAECICNALTRVRMLSHQTSSLMRDSFRATVPAPATPPPPPISPFRHLSPQSSPICRTP